MSDDPATESEPGHSRVAKVAAGTRIPAAGDTVKVGAFTGRVAEVFMVPSDAVYDRLFGMGEGDRLVMVRFA